MRKLVKDYIKTSDDIINLLGANSEDDKIYPNYYNGKAPYIILKIRPQERGLPKIDDVEFKIIDSDIDRLDALQDKIMELFDFGETNRHFNNGVNVIYTSHLTGSGELEYEELDLVERILNFEVKWR